MRRSTIQQMANMMATPRNATMEKGGTGTRLLAGRLYEEFRYRLLYDKWNIYHQMEADPQVAAVQAMIEMPLLGASWTVDPERDIDDETSSDLAIEIAADVQHSLMNMPEMDWQDFLQQALRGKFAGVALFEKVYYVRDDGKHSWLRFSPRLPRTVYRWLRDENGKLRAIHQRVSGTDHNVDVEIETEKLLRFTYDQDGDNFEGRGLYRAMYKPWFYVDLMEKEMAIAAGRTATGILYGKTQGKTTPKERATFLNMLQNVRNDEQAAFVLDETESVEMTPVSFPAHLLRVIQHYQALISKTALVQVMNMGEATHGSFAMAKEHTDFFMLTLNATANTVREVLQRSAIKEFVTWNYGANAPMPKLMFKINPKDILEYAESIFAAVKAKLIYPDDNIEELLREIYGLPPIDIEANRREGSPTPPMINGGDDDDEDDSDDDDMDMAEKSHYQDSLKNRPTPTALAMEFPADPTKDSTRPWRAFTRREKQFEFAELNSQWDAYVDEAARAIEKATDAATEKFVAGMQRQLKAGKYNRAIGMKLPAAFTTQIAAIYGGTLTSAAEWSAAHIAKGADLPAEPILPREHRNGKLIWTHRAERWTANVEASLTRKLMTDTALIADIEAGLIGAGVLASVAQGAMENYNLLKGGQLRAVAKAGVNGSIHTGLNSIVRSPEVGWILRSEALDNRTCPNCLSLDQLTFTKEEWGQIRPPKHCMGGALCRGTGIPIRLTEEPKPTITPIESVPSMQRPRLNERMRIDEVERFLE